MALDAFLIVVLACGISVLGFRVLPVIALGNRELSDSAERALNLVPVAAFAALVANDLIPDMTAPVSGPEAMVPLLATIPTIIVALKTRSLVWTALVGVASYALVLVLMPGL